MSMAAIYHGTAYVVQACASTISTMRYALMGHCVQGVALYHPMHSKLTGARTGLTIFFTFDTRGLFSLASMNISAPGTMSMFHVHSRC